MASELRFDLVLFLLVAAVFVAIRVLFCSLVRWFFLQPPTCCSFRSVPAVSRCLLLSAADLKLFAADLQLFAADLIL